MRAGVHPNEPRTSSVAPQEGLRREGRIAVCHIASGDRWAGAEAQLANLLTALARRAEFQLSLILLNEGQLAEEARASGVEVKVFPESRMSFVRILFQGTRFLKGKGIEILHSHRYKENLLAALLAWRCRIPRVVRSQHGSPKRLEGFSGPKEKLFRHVDCWVGRHATDCIIGVSADLCVHIRQCFKTPKVVVIPNGLDNRRVQSNLSVAEAKRRLEISEADMVIGTASRLDTVKRLDLFLAAASRIAARLPTARFVIAGGGVEANRLKEVAVREGLAERVIFLGHRSDIYDVLRALDIFVLCSDYEGLPMVLLEALSLGTAVVARRVGGIQEVLVDGINGVLTDSDDPQLLAEACLRLVADPKTRTKLGQAGAVTVAEHFSAATTAARVSELYHSLVGVAQRVS